MHWNLCLVVLLSIKMFCILSNIIIKKSTIIVHSNMIIASLFICFMLLHPHGAMIFFILQKAIKTIETNQEIVDLAAEGL